MASKRAGGRSADVQARVFAAARELFTAGEPLPTVPQIAARAGVQKTSIYRRWGTADALVYEALRAPPTTSIPVPDTGTLRGDLRAIVRASSTYLSSPEGASMTALLFAVPDDKKRAYWAKRNPALSVPFERAAARGEIASRADWSLYSEISAAQFYFYLWAKGEALPLRRRYQLIDVIVTALGG